MGETRPGEEDWRRVFLADTRTGGQPTIFVAESGRLATIPEDRVALLELDGVEVHNTSLYDPGPLPHPARGRGAAAARRRKRVRAGDGESAAKRPAPCCCPSSEAPSPPPSTPSIWWRSTRSSRCRSPVWPSGCSDWASALRPSPGPARAGVFAIAVLVVFGYYIPLTFGEQLAVDGELSPWLAMWSANLLTAAAGALLLVLASRQLDPLAALDRGLALGAPLPSAPSEDPPSRRPTPAASGNAHHRGPLCDHPLRPVPRHRAGRARRRADDRPADRGRRRRLRSRSAGAPAPPLSGTLAPGVRDPDAPSRSPHRDARDLRGDESPQRGDRVFSPAESAGPG